MLLQEHTEPRAPDHVIAAGMLAQQRRNVLREHRDPARTAPAQFRQATAVIDPSVQPRLEHPPVQLPQPWGLHHLRQWLRRRLEPVPPMGQDELERWWQDERRRLNDGEVIVRPSTADRMYWTKGREVALYNQVRQLGANIPPLLDGPQGQEMQTEHERAFMKVLLILGAFNRRPGSMCDFWLGGATLRETWMAFREEGYVYSDNTRGGRREGYHGWVGMKYESAHYPPLLENQRFLE